MKFLKLNLEGLISSSPPGRWELALGKGSVALSKMHGAWSAKWKAYNMKCSAWSMKQAIFEKVEDFRRNGRVKKKWHAWSRRFSRKWKISEATDAWSRSGSGRRLKRKWQWKTLEEVEFFELVEYHSHTRRLKRDVSSVKRQVWSLMCEVYYV